MLIKGLIFCFMLVVGLLVVRMGKDDSTECTKTNR